MFQVIITQSLILLKNSGDINISVHSWRRGGRREGKAFKVTSLPQVRCWPPFYDENVYQQRERGLLLLHRRFLSITEMTQTTLRSHGGQCDKTGRLLLDLNETVTLFKFEALWPSKTMTCRFKYKYLYPTYFQKGFQADYANINTKPRQVEVIFWIIGHSGLTVTLALWAVRSWLHGRVPKTWKELSKGRFAISYKANDGDEKRATTRCIWMHAAE